ncbi:heme-binding protein [Sphingosinicella sp. BN140058]|uniref:GlcG/HbpS family heme-binding protein n=1 Tax=Sphingosinicella sp. BN140058 TaxID=1892855 RepID=UPI001010381E|nr:heme-binding protein [Sphingosinicella sp. BN140058]QAY78108.1 heme-binding protein [Sphingosinicella sp. BN140058]
MPLSLSQAQAMLAGALAEANGRDARPLGIIVLDAGGHPVAYARQDGASLFRFDIARAKAMGALGMGADTRDIAARAAANPAFFTSVAIATGGALALSPGGLLVRDRGGDLFGAIGISGDTPDVDEACARAGIDAAGLSHSGGTP